MDWEMSYPSMVKQKILLKDIPFHRKVPNTTFIVDYFTKDVIDSEHYFLTHYHSDHFYGLTKKFQYFIYCSETTSNLIKKFIGVDSQKVKMVEMSRVFDLNGVKILFYEANHCPGAVGIIFCVNSKIYLHTGDFRFNYEVHHRLNDFIDFFDIPIKKKYDLVFYDNTYEDYHIFESQSTVIKHLIHDIAKLERPTNNLAKIPTKYIFTSYFIGKERLFLTVAHYFNWRVNVSDRRLKMYKCFNKYTTDFLNEMVLKISDSIGKIDISPRFSFLKKIQVIPSEERKTPLDLICQDDQAQIDILSMNDITPKRLTEIYGNRNYRRIMIFCGTGWSRKEKSMDFVLKNGTRYKNGIRIAQYPYSEHSSSSELREFKSFIRAQEIVPTVNFRSLTEIE